MPMPDVVIRAGRLLDGSGLPAVTADIAIRDGAVAEIGRVRDRAHRIIDADGALVIPGLTALMPPPSVAPFDRNAARHLAPGVTTVVEELPASATTADAVAAYLHHLRAQPALLSRVILASHHLFRAAVMGNKIRDELASSNADIEAMGTLLGDALDLGARGVLLAPDAPHSERVAVIEELAPRWSERSGEQPVAVMIPTHYDEDLDEALHHARRILSLSDATPSVSCSVIISVPEPVDDPNIGSALSPGSETTVEILIEALSTGRSVPGLGLNPLAFLAGHSPDSTLDLPALIERLADTAALVGLKNRGVIASHNPADINIIDRTHLTDDLSAGVVSTLVSGTEIVSFDELTGEAPGQLL
ncbi:MAG: hypothetical protein HKN03_00830 [Acidimicrobiales bacterium]|nr:hypothetical protein [Acidimicrobiales bacterium]